MDHHHYQLPHQKPHTCCVEGTWGGEADTWREYTCHPEHRLVSVLSFTVSYCLLSGWGWGCRGWDTESWKFFSQMFPFLSQQGKTMAPAAFSQTLWCSLTCPLQSCAIMYLVTHLTQESSLCQLLWTRGAVHQQQQNHSCLKTDKGHYSAWDNFSLLRSSLLWAQHPVLYLTSLLMENYQQRRFPKAYYSTNQ